MPPYLAFLLVVTWTVVRSLLPSSIAERLIPNSWKSTELRRTDYDRYISGEIWWFEVADVDDLYNSVVGPECRDMALVQRTVCGIKTLPRGTQQLILRGTKSVLRGGKKLLITANHITLNPFHLEFRPGPVVSLINFLTTWASIIWVFVYIRSKTTLLAEKLSRVGGMIEINIRPRLSACMQQIALYFSQLIQIPPCPRTNLTERSRPDDSFQDVSADDEPYLWNRPAFRDIVPSQDINEMEEEEGRFEGERHQTSASSLVSSEGDGDDHRTVWKKTVSFAPEPLLVNRNESLEIGGKRARLDIDMCGFGSGTKSPPKSPSPSRASRSPRSSSAGVHENVKITKRHVGAVKPKVQSSVPNTVIDAVCENVRRTGSRPVSTRIRRPCGSQSANTLADVRN